MKILALDLGATTGWAYVVDGTVEGYGQVFFPGARAERFHGFDKWLHEETPYEIDVVAFERPFSRGLHATRSLWGMAAIAEHYAHTRGVASLDIVPVTLKKWATSKHNASKADMIIAAARKILKAGQAFTLREDEADAIIVGLFVHEKAEVVK